MEGVKNGRAMAAFLAAGVGASAIGLFVILDATAIFTAPALYGPAGGASGRTTLGVIVWLVAWFGLHVRWKDRQIDHRGVHVATALLVATGIVATLPPVWLLFE